mmetsp:Transcript_16514/g.31194  ORF Transcript_16514/g.31194 Transcript_16514/m.31194 type:complete len:80 (-) Transcript_16514:499-738(-)
MADEKTVPELKENVKENGDIEMKDAKKMTMRESQRIEDPIMDEPWCCYHNKEGELSWSGLTCKVWCKYNLVMLSTRVLL